VGALQQPEPRYLRFRGAGILPSIKGGHMGASAPRRRRLLFAGLAVFVVIALAAGVATRGHLWGPQKADNAATAADPHDLGAGVMVVSGQVPDGLQARVVTGGMKVDGNRAKPAGQTVDIGPSGKLPGPLTFQFALNRVVPKDAVVIVFTRPSGEGAWTPIETKLTANRLHAQVTVDHLSEFSQLLVPIKEIVDEIKKNFHEITSGAVEDAEQPTCDHQRAAQEAGYNARQSGADTLLWCLDLQDNKGVLRTENKRRYPLLLAHKGLDRLSGAISNNVAESISRRLALDGTVLYPADDAAFGADLPHGRRAIVKSTYDGMAQFVGSLYVGVDVLLTILSKFGVLKKQPHLVLEVMDKLLLSDACLRSRSPGSMLANCLNPKQLMEVFGTAAGVVLSPIVTVASVFDYFQNSIHALWDQWKDRADTELTLDRGADTSRFIGNWRVHGWQLEIRANRTASITWNAGGCGPVTCTGHGELRWWPLGGNLRLKYERTWLTANTPGNPTVPDDWGTVPDPTGTFDLKWVEQGLLERVDPNKPPANPFWCGEGLAESQLDKCGA
jgi:hypothetical protein